MRALRLRTIGDALAMCDVEMRAPGAGEVAVEIHAAGVCHSDAHYATESGRVTPPITLGHEIAGIVVETGPQVTALAIGDRVAVHYLIACLRCDRCRRYGEQFCETGAMIGKDRDGGFAERIIVPERNAVPVPAEVNLTQAAIMMCSSATAFHALRLASLAGNEALAILGFGGLGVSALRLGHYFGADPIVVVDVIEEKLLAARRLGAIAVHAGGEELREAILRTTGGREIDVAVDFAGNAPTVSAAARSLAPGGRLMIVAINLPSLDLDPYRDLLARERRVIGCSDHTREELVDLLDLVAAGEVDLSGAITRTIPFDAGAVNDALSDLHRGSSHLRTAIDFRR